MMVAGRILCYYFCLISSVKVISARICPQNNVQAACGDEAAKSSEESCVTYHQRNVGKLECCWIPTSEVKCQVYKRALSRKQILRFLKAYRDTESFRTPKIKNPKQLEPIRDAATNIGSDVKFTHLTSNKGRRLKNKIMIVFGEEGSETGSALPILNSLAGLDFPQCPVDVKVCHRVPCGGYNQPQYQQAAQSCYRNPQCCYDHDLAFYRTIFGPSYMEGSPLCYYGPTSQQWKEITDQIQQWNPWMSSFVTAVFEDLLDTSLINVNGKSACQFSLVRRQSEGSTKLQCNLRGSCWDDISKSCFYPDKFAQDYFRDQQVYPELYTNDANQAKCKLNPFDYGNTAYGRIPCASGTPPTNVAQLINTWCPLDECCLNYMDLPTTTIASILLLQKLNANGVYPGSSSIPGLSELSSISSATALKFTPILCPYNFIEIAPYLPDLSSSVDGCCTVPTCYHKKTLLNNIPPSPIAAWGQWGECQAECNQYGTRMRACYYYGTTNPAPNTLCAGVSIEQCLGSTCAPPGTWGGWQPSSSCSRSCGGGVMRYRATYCLVDGVPQAPGVGWCPGTGEREEPCNTQSCQQAQYLSWAQISPCSQTCGGGVARYRGTCFLNGNIVSSSLCSGPEEQQRPCNEHACDKVPAYGTWYPVGTCSVTCGLGSQRFSRQCLYNGNKDSVAPLEACLAQGPPDTMETCDMGECIYTYSYGSWAPMEPCGVTCGAFAVHMHRRRCFVGKSFVETDLSNCAQFGPSQELKNCNLPSCPAMPVQYFWTGWSTWSPCQTQQNADCERKSTRMCYQKMGPSYVKVQPQTKCGELLEKTQPCQSAACNVIID